MAIALCFWAITLKFQVLAITMLIQMAITSLGYLIGYRFAYPNGYHFLPDARSITPAITLAII